MTASTAAAAAVSTATSTTPQQILLYVPNIIGYARIIAVLMSYVCMMLQHWKLAIALYLGSFIGDMADGMAARKLQQTSNFGGLLDMITDRCGTLGLLFVLSTEYAPVEAELAFPFFRLAFLSLVLLDVSSHWCQMYASLSAGLHHKSDENNHDKNILVQWFYKYYWFFGYLCVGAEFTYVLAYAKRHVASSSDAASWIHAGLIVCLPGCVAKQIVNICQLTSACYSVAKQDALNKQKNQ